MNADARNAAWMRLHNGIVVAHGWNPLSEEQTRELADRAVRAYLDALDTDALIEPLLDDEVITAQDAVLTLLAAIRPVDPDQQGT